LPQTERVAEGILSLPVYDSLPAQSVRKIADAIIALRR
jgi:dTDP-4-amino-4,6-dideoxygalactose transaminase